MHLQVFQPDTMFTPSFKPFGLVVLMRYYQRSPSASTSSPNTQIFKPPDLTNLPKAIQTGHLANSPPPTLATNLKPPDLES